MNEQELAKMKKVEEFQLEKTTEEFIKKLQASKGKPIYQMNPQEARKTLETLQSPKKDFSSITIENKIISAGPKGKISLQIFRPKKEGRLPAIMYFHGAGWVMGSDLTHHQLACRLAGGTESAIIFVSYSLSPEARFPIAIEELYSATKYIYEQGESLQLDASNLSIAGDSVGANMAIAVTFLAKEREGPKITSQVLFYPVTDASLSTSSYAQFSEGPWLTKPAMEWFWNAYQPNVIERNHPLLSPLKANLEQLKNLPKALIITAENDVLRDEGEAYAYKLMQAGVEVTAIRYLGTIHDFVMLNALAETAATKSAIQMACQFLK